MQRRTRRSAPRGAKRWGSLMDSRRKTITRTDQARGMVVAGRSIEHGCVVVISDLDWWRSAGRRRRRVQVVSDPNKARLDRLPFACGVGERLLHGFNGPGNGRHTGAEGTETGLFNFAAIPAAVLRGRVHGQCHGSVNRTHHHFEALTCRGIRRHGVQGGGTHRREHGDKRQPDDQAGDRHVANCAPRCLRRHRPVSSGGVAEGRRYQMIRICPLQICRRL